MDHCGRRAGPLREDGNVASEGGVVDLIEEDAEKGRGLITWVGPKFTVDLNYKRGGDSGEKTCLISWLASVRHKFKLRASRGTHEDQGRIQIIVILLQKYPVVFLSNLAVMLVESSFMFLLSV